MKHIVYVRAVDEAFEGVLTSYDGQTAISALAEEDFATDGVLLYEYDGTIVLKGNPKLVMDTFAGWEPTNAAD